MSKNIKAKSSIIDKLKLKDLEETIEKLNILDDKYTEEYIKKFNLNNIIVLMLKEFLDKKLFPINPYPFMIKILKQTMLLNQNKDIRKDFEINFIFNYIKETDINGVFTLKNKSNCYGLKNLIKLLDENISNKIKENLGDYINFDSSDENYIFCSIGGSLWFNDNFIKYKLSYSYPLDINICYFDLGTSKTIENFAKFILADVKKITNENNMNFFKSFNVDMIEDEFYNKKYEFNLKDITLNNKQFVDFIISVMKKKIRLYCKIYIRCNDNSINYILIRRFYYLYKENKNYNFDSLNPLFEGIFLNLNDISYFLDFNKFRIGNFKNNILYKEHIENKIFGISIPFIQQNILNLCFNLLFLLIYESDKKFEESLIQILIILNNKNTELKEFSNKIRYLINVIKAYLKLVNNKLKNVESSLDLDNLENIIFVKIYEIINICNDFNNNQKNIEILRFLPIINYLIYNLKQQIDNKNISKNTINIWNFIKSIFNMGKEISSQYNFNINNKIKDFIKLSLKVNKFDLKYDITFLEEFQKSKNTLRTFNVDNTVINYSKITDDKLIASNEDILNLLLNFYLEYTNILPILREIFLDLYFGSKPQNPLGHIINLLNKENQKQSLKNILAIFENKSTNFVLEEGFFGKRKIQGFHFINDGNNLRGEFLGNKLILKYMNFDKIKSIYNILKNCSWRKGISVEMSQYDIKEIYYFKCKNLIKYTIENEFKNHNYNRYYGINCDFVFESKPLLESITILSKIIVIWICYLNSLKEDINNWYIIPLGVYNQNICIASLSKILLKNQSNIVHNELINLLKDGNRLKVKLFLKYKNKESIYFILDVNISILLSNKTELVSPSEIKLFNIYYSIFPNPDDISYLLTYFNQDKIKMNTEIRNNITKNILSGDISSTIKYHIIKAINENNEKQFFECFKIINYDSEYIIYFIDAVNFCWDILDLYIINNSNDLIGVITNANNLNIFFLNNEIKFLKSIILKNFKLNETAEGDSLCIRIINLLELISNSLLHLDKIKEEKYFFEILKSIFKGLKKIKKYLFIISNLYIIMNIEVNKSFDLLNF